MPQDNTDPLTVSDRYLIKEEPAWRHEVATTAVTDRHTIQIVTPTGHGY